MQEEQKREIEEIFSKQKANEGRLRNRSAYARKQSLKALKEYLFDHREELYSVLQEDLHKCPEETDMTELFPILTDIKDAIDNVERWIRFHKVPTPMLLGLARSEIIYTAKGVSLIIAPWNYPVNLTICPLVGAIAAGCPAIIKPSEYTPKTSAFIQKMIADLFDPDEAYVALGDYRVASFLLDLPFRHIFFTGSTRVGQIVMEKASKHLSSVTLELGGKSPAIITDKANLKQAARKIAWGKYLNAGQTCVAPDYLLIDRRQLGPFVEALEDEVKRMYYTDRLQNYTHIINRQHFHRLKKHFDDALEKGAKLIFGGEADEENLLIEPTALTEINEQMTIMQEEIFGPLLPILAYEDLQDALETIRQKPTPLALYVFTNSETEADQILRNTRSGGACVNDVVLHLSNPHLPFGGAGESGFGNYHGFYSFRAFSDERAVFKQFRLLATSEIAYPPYGESKSKLIDILLKIFT